MTSNSSYVCSFRVAVVAQKQFEYFGNAAAIEFPWRQFECHAIPWLSLMVWCQLENISAVVTTVKGTAGVLLPYDRQ